jgi:Metallo-peptidase family M12
MQGTVEGHDAFDRCNLYEENGRIAGDVDVQSGRFAIVPVGDTHAVVEVKTQAFPNESEPLPASDVPPDGVARDANIPLCDVPPPSGQAAKVLGPLRVMVVYTTAARTGINIATAIEQLRDQLRDAYARNDGNFKVTTEIVHAEEVAYSEPRYSDSEKAAYSQNARFQLTRDMDVDLWRLTDPQDEFFKHIHELRARHKAHIIHLITMRDPAQNGCGLGWIVPDVGAGLAARGFSTSGRQCALQNFSFAHEIGHNIGMGHDRGVVTNPRPGAFNFGYVLAAHCVRSVMAYDNACRDACASKGGCRRLNVFSSPRLRFRDAAPFGRPLNDALAAYNMEVLCRAGTVLSKNDTAAQGGNETAFDVQIELPKTVFSPGETFTFAVRSNKDCNLLVYTVDANDKVELHDPNVSREFMGDPRLAAGERRVIPVAGRARITETSGEYQIGAVCGRDDLAKLGITDVALKKPAAEGRRSFTFVIEQIAKRIDRTQLARATVTYKVD